MRAPWLVPVVAAAFLGCAALPASAAPPVRFVDPVDAEEEELLTNLFTEACGVPVDVEGSGRSTTTEFTNGAGELVRVQVVFATRFVVTNTDTGATFTLRDVGPDRILFENGVAVELQQIGRSVTGSGVIGRTIVDLTGQQPDRSTGKVFGDFVERTCDAIA